LNYCESLSQLRYSHIAVIFATWLFKLQFFYSKNLLLFPFHFSLLFFTSRFRLGVQKYYFFYYYQIYFQLFFTLFFNTLFINNLELKKILKVLVLLDYSLL
jgi:hypothetical protein